MADEKRLTTNERFTMAPVALIELMRNGVITPQAYALWHVLWSHSDSEKRECWPSVPTLATAIGMRSENGVKAHITKLVDAGLVEVYERYEGGRQLSNGYRLHPNCDARDRGGVTTVMGEGSPQRRGRGHHSDDEQEPENNNQLTRTTLSPNRTDSERVTIESDENDTGSADAGKDGKAVEVPGEKLTDKSVRNGLVGERLTDKSVHLTDKSVPPNTLELYKEDKDEQMFSIAEDVGTASREEAKTMPHLLPVGWKPNDIHRAMFERLHPGDDMTLFTDCFIALHDGVESGDWDKKFGAYINRVAESEAAQVTHLDMELNLTA